MTQDIAQIAPAELFAEAEAGILAPQPALPQPGLHGDLTQGPILKTLIVFAMPALVANIFQTVGGSINEP